MKRFVLILCLVAASGGCSSLVEEDEAPDARAQVMYAPEVSHPRECKRDSQPPGPQRNEIQKTNYELITQAEAVAPPQSATTFITAPPAQR